VNRSFLEIQAAKDAFLGQREELARVLGIQTVDLLIDRALTETYDAYPRLRAISIESDELNLASLDEAFQNSTFEEANTALNALTAVMLMILARLLGRRVAESIAVNINRTDPRTALRA